MIYPKFLKRNSTIGVTATSDGIVDLIKLNRLNNAIKKLNDYGFKVIETDNVRMSNFGRSSDSKTRAKQFNDLIENKSVDLISFSSGGDFFIEALPYINFKSISKNIKWLQGYSDPSAILYIVTTWLDIATLYTNNFCSYGMDLWHKSIKNNIKILTSNIVSQKSFEYYEKDPIPYVTGLEGYNLNEKVHVKRLFFDDNVKFEGRIIGGCLDVILDIIGTKFDKTKNFIKKYKEDGIIWYFDICELTNDGLVRAMWQLKNSSYFKYCNGIIFGRTGNDYSYYDISFKSSLEHVFSDKYFKNIPIIYDADIGHKSPQITIINGAIAKISYFSNNSLEVNFKLK